MVKSASASRRLGGPVIAEKYWKISSWWFLSRFKYAQNPSPCMDGEWDTSPHIPPPWMPSAPQSRRVRDEKVVIGPRENNCFPGPVEALHGPVEKPNMRWVGSGQDRFRSRIEVPMISTASRPIHAFRRLLAAVPRCKSVGRQLCVPRGLARSNRCRPRLSSAAVT